MKDTNIQIFCQYRQVVCRKLHPSCLCHVPANGVNVSQVERINAEVSLIFYSVSKGQISRSQLAVQLSAVSFHIFLCKRLPTGNMFGTNQKITFHKSKRTTVISLSWDVQVSVWRYSRIRALQKKQGKWIIRDNQYS